MLIIFIVMMITNIYRSHSGSAIRAWRTTGFSNGARRGILGCVPFPFRPFRTLTFRRVARGRAILLIVVAIRLIVVVVAILLIVVVAIRLIVVVVVVVVVVVSFRRVAGGGAQQGVSPPTAHRCSWTFVAAP